MTLSQRFWAKVEKTDTCWLWTAATTKNGYGKITLNGHTVSTHRLAYEMTVGPIPAALTIDHLCRVRNCVNPDHLEPVTQIENARRARHALKTHCASGHALAGDNLLTEPRPGYVVRRCRACRNARRRIAA